MSEDPELAAIRASRMAQMQGQGGADQMRKQQEQAEQQAMMTNSMLAQILDQGARARLNSIAMVKPEKAAAVEKMLIQMANSKQIQGKVNEDTLIGILERVNKQLADSTKTTISRRRYAMDSDDDDFWSENQTNP